MSEPTTEAGRKMAAYLRADWVRDFNADIRTIESDAATASEEPQDKPWHRHDWAWGGDGAWDYCTDPDCRATRSHWEDPR